MRSGFRGVGMAAAAVASLVLGGEGTLPAGRGKGSSRRRNLGLGLLSAMAAASAGAAFGMVGSPNPRDENRVASAAYTAAVAVQSAQRSEERARAAEKALAEVESRLEQLRVREPMLLEDRLGELERLLAVTAQRAREPLGDDAVDRVGDHERLDVHVDQAGDRAGGVARVKRG